ncbi:MAG: LacI family DNA-binding transcriptional regulator [Lawsonibacter sp.]
MQKKTIYDVAREAGVSISTVSRVINGSPKVKEETRRRVEAACADYRPVASARELQTKRTKTIGVLINHRPEYFFLNETYTNALLGISVAAKECGYRLLLDISEDETGASNLFYEQKVEGFILMGVKKSSSLLENLKADDVPFVLVGSFHGDEEGVCQIDINDQKAVYNATNYLIGLGHERIGIITGSLEYTSCSDRLAGYKQALEGAGIPVQEGWIQICENLTELKAEQLAKHLFYQNPRVTAVVAFNDSVAMAVYKAGKDCGLSIPEQLSVIGFDDTTVASYMSPPLTSVWQPSYDKGERAMRLLIDCLEKGVMPKKREELNCIIMYRESCAAPCGE